MPIEVQLIDSLGNDMTVVNAARVSMDKVITSLRDADIKLIYFLAEHGHMSPFRHVQFQLRVNAPEFVARQAYKHVVGISATAGPLVTNDAAWNEVSLRYVRARDFFIPDENEWRHAPETARQGSSATRTLDDNAKQTASQVYSHALDTAIEAYQTLLNLGVAREMARMILPLSTQTSWIWTISLQAAAHFVKLRATPEAQYEIAILANKIED